MRNHWMILVALLVLDAQLLAGLWWWHWPLGFIIIAMLCEAVIAAGAMVIETVHHGHETPGAWAVGVGNALAIVLLVGGTSFLGAYYLFMYGSKLGAYLLVPILLLVARYAVEVGVRWRQPQFPSQVLIRWWLRSMLLIALVAVSGLVPLVILVGTFPFELPHPGAFLCDWQVHRDGIPADVSRLVGAWALTIIVFVSTALQVMQMYASRTPRWRWLDRMIGIHRLEVSPPFLEL